MNKWVQIDNLSWSMINTTQSIGNEKQLETKFRESVKNHSILAILAAVIEYSLNYAHCGENWKFHKLFSQFSWTEISCGKCNLHTAPVWNLMENHNLESIVYKAGNGIEWIAIKVWE